MGSEVADRPLAGRTIVVTRATEQASTLVERLVELGADVVAIPVIAIVDAGDGGAALVDAASRAGSYDWIVVTSTNGADRLVAASAGGSDALAACGAGFAAIGRGTAEALRRHGIEVALLPDRFVAEGLLEVFPTPPAAGGRVLLAQAAGARPVLAEGLLAAGWNVDVVEAYRTIHPPVPAESVAAASQADVITFTSASTVEGWIDAVGRDALPEVVATIGPITSSAVAAHGVDVDIEAEVHSIDGLVDALIEQLGSPGASA